MKTLHAIVTGGSSGMGREFGRSLGDAGYGLPLVAGRKELLDEAAADIASHFKNPTQRVFTRSADVSEVRQAEAAVQACIVELGTPDLVVTSAGVAVPGYFGDTSLEAHERSMAVNYFGSLYVVRAALPSMRERRKGRLVFISSGAGLMGLFGYTTYSPSKFALRGLAEALRAELSAENIGVSIVYPPDTETPMLEEENKIKPEETKLITGVVKTWSAEAVAEGIMRGISRGAFRITPGMAITMMNRAPGVTIPLLSWYCDWLVAGLRRKRAQRSQKSHNRAA